MLLNLFRRRNALPEAAADLYAAIVEQARKPAFYRDLGVPDTVLGRFEMIALHAFLVFRRLRDADVSGQRLAQETHDLMFVDMDRSLRELGIGDMGIGKRVKMLARNLYGRIEAYETGLDAGADNAALADALRRNVFASGDIPRPEQVDELAGYLRREVAALDGQDSQALLSGQIRFGAAPGEATTAGAA